MGRLRYSHNSFSIGVLSKKVHGNTEFEGYNNALVECVNFVVQPTGGLFKRSGTVFVGEANSDTPVLVLFSYDADNQYICEFGAGYIRFYVKDGLVKNRDGDVIEVETEFTAEDVKSMKTFQDGNVLVLVTPKGLFMLKRTDEVTFQISRQLEYTFEPISFMNTEAIGLKPDKTNENITFVCVNPKSQQQKPDAEYAPVFFDDDVGHYLVLTYKIKNEGSQVFENKRIYLTIDTVVDDTEGFKKITATIDATRSDDKRSELPSLDVVTLWQIGAFTQTRGMPKAVSVYEGRLFLANNESAPTGIWGSGKFYNDWRDFSIGTNDSDAVMFRMSGLHADEILWLSSQSKLFIGTRWGIYIGGAATYNDEAITPSNFRLRLFDTAGASELQPIAAADSVFFVDVSGKNVHEIHLSAETDTYQAENISLLSSDLTESGILAHTWQQNPITTYWCAVQDGHLCSLTYLKNNGIMAWTKHIISGNNVKIEGLCTMRGEKNDLIWMVVRREINGEFKRYIEYIHSSYNPLDQEEFRQFYVDSGVSKDIKYYIADIGKGNNANINFIPSVSYVQLSELFTRNNGVANVMFYAPAYTAGLPFSEHKKFIAKNLKTVNRRSRSLDIFNYYLVNGKEQAGKISEDEFASTDVPNYQIYIEVTDILRHTTAHSLQVVDRRYIPTYGRVILEDTGVEEIDFSTSGNCFIAQNIRGYLDRITLRNADNPRIRIDVSRINRGKIFIILGNLTSCTRSVNLELTLDEPISAEIDVNRVYINKVNGMTQLNQRSYKVANISADRQTLQLFDEEASILCDTDIQIDDTYYSQFDRVNPTGNVYIYFNSISGLQHLVNQTVAICADGNSMGTQVVPVNGILEFERPIMYVSVGLPMKSYMKTTPFSGGSLIGSSVGSVGNNNPMWLHLYYSLGGRYGADSNRTYQIPYTNFITGFSKPKNLISGVLQCPLINSSDMFDRSIYIEHSEPLAFNILSITQDVEVSDA